MGKSSKKNKKITNECLAEYKYPPVYKYGFLLLTIYMLLKHQKLMTQDKLLTNSIIIILIFGVVDYIIIDNHPSFFYGNPSENQMEKLK